LEPTYYGQDQDVFPAPLVHGLRIDDDDDIDDVGTIEYLLFLCYFSS